MLEHKHLILRGRINTPESAEVIAETLTELVTLVQMRVLSPAHVVHCVEHGNVGYTGTILLTTSHMAWHDWTRQDGTSDFQFDLYSCAPFDVNTVVSYLGARHFLIVEDWKLFDREYRIAQKHSFDETF